MEDHVFLMQKNRRIINPQYLKKHLEGVEKSRLWRLVKLKKLLQRRKNVQFFLHQMLLLLLNLQDLMLLQVEKPLLQAQPLQEKKRGRRMMMARRGILEKNLLQMQREQV